MFTTYMNSNGEFEFEGVTWKVDVVKRPALGILGDGEIRKYIQLYKNGEQWMAVSNVDLKCSGMEANTISEFIDMLKEAVNDNFFANKINVTIPLDVYRNLFIKWK